MFFCWRALIVTPRLRSGRKRKMFSKSLKPMALVSTPVPPPLSPFTSWGGANC